MRWAANRASSPRDWAEATSATSALAMNKVEDGLAAKGPEAPRTRTSSARSRSPGPTAHVEWFEGRVDGALVWPPRGDNGFGYDPMFVPTA